MSFSNINVCTERSRALLGGIAGNFERVLFCKKCW